MKKQIVTAAALIALAATALGAVHVTDNESPRVCIPAAVVQAWS
ncbi:MAG TPA: hypothetical protein VM183_08120 [Burkholderiales bacterium]|nr:hypothetical protein [Burkholderiales bacterium]